MLRSSNFVDVVAGVTAQCCVATPRRVLCSADWAALCIVLLWCKLSVSQPAAHLSVLCKLLGCLHLPRSSHLFALYISLILNGCLIPVGLQQAACGLVLTVLQLHVNLGTTNTSKDTYSKVVTHLAAQKNSSTHANQSLTKDNRLTGGLLPKPKPKVCFVLVAADGPA